MSPRTAKRFPATVTAMVGEEEAATVKDLADQEQVSRADVLRDVIRFGLPAVQKEYERRRLQRAMRSLEEVPA